MEVTEPIDTGSKLLAVTDSSHVGEVRRTLLSFAARLQFDEIQRGNLAIVASEMATNLLKHATGGEIVYRALISSIERNQSVLEGIEVLALDRGPGMANVDRCLVDGFSTVGTAGTGLGAIQRQSKNFDIYSGIDLGTVLVAQVARLHSNAPTHAARGLRIGAVCLPVASETRCGDGWSAHNTGHRHLVCLVDGLGHGPIANEAASEALRVFEDCFDVDPVEIMHRTHIALRKTRGAAVGIAEIDTVQQRLRFVGVGNISGAVVQGTESKTLISHNGTVGHQLHKIQDFSYAWNHHATVVLHSDGLATRWRLEAYPGIVSRHPTLIAGLLFRDHRRPRDDNTVVVVRSAGV